MNAFSAALRMQEDRNALLYTRERMRVEVVLGLHSPFRQPRKLRRLSTESATRRVLGLKGHR